MRVLLTILLLAWLAIGSIWSNRTFCAKKTKTKAATTAAAAASGGSDCGLMFHDGDAFKASSNTNFRFHFGSADLVNTPEGDFYDVLQKATEYLATDADKTILIEGQYYENEKNPEEFDNIGLARASKIKGYLVDEFLVDDTQIKLGSAITSGCYNKNNKLLGRGATVTFGTK